MKVQSLIDRPARLTGALTAIAFLLAAAGLLLEPHVGHNADTIRYHAWAGNFTHALNTQGDSYSVGRMLPPMTVHYALVAMGLKTSFGNVTNAFAVLDALAVVVTAFAWCRIAEALDLGPKGKVVGFAALIFNFALLKWAPYQPVMTDASAYMVSTLAIWAWISRRDAPLVLLAVIGAFTWPGELFLIAVLLAFPRAEGTPVRPTLRRGGVAIAVVVAAVVVGFAVKLIAEDHTLGASATPPVKALFPLSIAVAALYVGAGLAYLFSTDAILDVRKLARSLWRPRTLLVAGLVITALLTQGQIVTQEKARLSVTTVPETTVWTGLGWPGVFAVAWIGFFGPILILAVVAWRRVAGVVQAAGPGAILVIGLVVVLGLAGHSRLLTNVYPLLVPFVVVALMPQRWTWTEVLGFAAICLVFSKVVLPPNWLYDGAYGAVSYGMLQLVATLAAGTLIVLRWRAIERRDEPPPPSPQEETPSLVGAPGDAT